MPTEVRHAMATWTGDLLSGAGTVDYVSSGAFSRMPVTWASRTTAHNGKTSPEELLAAAHAACFSMAFSSRLAKNGTPATTLEVRVEVTFEQGEAGWKVAASKIKVTGTVPGIDKATFDRLVEETRTGCPVSRALQAVPISVQASLG